VKELVYFIPNRKEKEEISVACEKVMNALKGLSLNQAAMVLKIFDDAVEKKGVRVEKIAYRREE